MGFNKVTDIFSILIVLLNIQGSCCKENIPVAVNPSCSCGKINDYSDKTEKGFITGGIETEPHAYPWQAHVIIHKGNSTKVLFMYTCGGTVINDWYILTAAHCVVQGSAGWITKQIEVILGVHNISIYSDQNKYYVTKVIPHEYYFRLIRDIALLKLDRPIIFSEIISPICIPKQDANWFEGKNVTVIGWGRTKFYDQNSSSASLLEVNLKVLSPKECWKYLQEIYHGILYATGMESMLCAYDKEMVQKDACQGDSGGPMFFKTKKRRAIQVGIVSYGFLCGFLPGGYAKVSQFTNWILRHTQDATYCYSPLIKKSTG